MIVGKETQRLIISQQGGVVGLVGAGLQLRCQERGRAERADVNGEAGGSLAEASWDAVDRCDGELDGEALSR